MSNGEDTVVKGMLGRELGRTLSLAVVGADTSVRSLAPGGGELWAAKHHQRSESCWLGTGTGKLTPWQKPL